MGSELRIVISAWIAHGIFRPETCQWWWQKLLSAENERKISTWEFCWDKNHRTEKKKKKTCLFNAGCLHAEQISALGLFQGLWKPPSEPDILGVEGPFFVWLQAFNMKGENLARLMLQENGVVSSQGSCSAVLSWGRSSQAQRSSPGGEGRWQLALGWAGSSVSRKGLLVSQAKEVRRPVAALSLFVSSLLEGSLPLID